ncbi:4'-phosphopantetheinyl transferase superfamily protein [Xanthomonas sp. A2111]|uniref:Enterobactin synthase component D n=1 Tax=Xanthomonas hawaiiensis TaxID=3003247 RepID=A0ABU2I0N5_9XANT|nr:4'-phosphopantetheinyl transferase superfamily protein [Xanthomonas sp. A2111]MBO9830234.1 4'-phosphopantetheinyl transferase superfamily protein [Xanthomonas sp. A2111]MDS9991706.1 4'-phosphopantetheinyl transferase superfamily protein [Xanthomonas sp. A2111]
MDALAPVAPPFARLALGAHRIAMPDAWLLPFDIDAFDNDDFQRHGLQRPPSIARSVRKRQAEYLAGRRAALAALQAAGSAATDLPIGADRAPVWPAGFLGSLSHTDGLAVAIALPASAGANGIGLDVERVVAEDQLEAIRNVALDASDCDALAALARIRGWPYALTLGFSAKESFYKAAAATVGRFFDFGALRVEGCDPDSGHVDTRIATPLAPALTVGQRHRLRWVDVQPGLLLTSCVW